MNKTVFSNFNDCLSKTNAAETSFFYSCDTLSPGHQEKHQILFQDASKEILGQSFIYRDYLKNHLPPIIVNSEKNPHEKVWILTDVSFECDEEKVAYSYEHAYHQYLATLYRHVCDFLKTRGESYFFLCVDRDTYEDICCFSDWSLKENVLLNFHPFQERDQKVISFVSL